MPKKYVLLIDDDMAIATALTLRLRAAGHDVISARDGRSGVVEAAAHRPDVILLDIRMPDIDGYEVCRRLKSDPELASIPVIFVSANAHESARDQAYQVGGSAFLSKPYEPGQVLATIESVTGPVGDMRV